MQGKVKETRKGWTEKLKQKDAASRLRVVSLVLREVLWAGAGFLFGQGSMLFGTNPLGVALLCASSGHVFPILAGLILGAVFSEEQPWVLIVTYVAAALIRAISARLADPRESRRRLLPAHIRKKLRGTEADKLPETEVGLPRSRAARLWSKITSSSGAELLGTLRSEIRSLFSEWVLLRMVTAATCMLIVSLFRVIGGGFRYYDLYAAFFAVFAAPAAVMVYSVWLEGRRELRVLYALSAGALLFSAVWASDALLFGIVPLSAFFALFLSLWAARRVGAVGGVAAAILAGLAHDPMSIPAYLIAVLIYSLASIRKKTDVGIPIAVFAALGWSIYAHGISVLIPLLLSNLTAGALITVLSHFGETSTATETAVSTPTSDDAAARLRYVTNRHEDAKDRLRRISDAFSSLSEMFYNLSDRLRRPTTLDLHRLCDASFDRFCPNCPNKTVCWGLEYADTLEVLGGLASALHTRGTVTEKQITPVLFRRCSSMTAILADINHECSELTGNLLRDNRTEIFAMDYEAAANIINDALEEDDGEYRLDADLSSRICEYLASAGISAQSVVVYGGRLRRVIVRGVDVEQANVTTETLRSDLGEMCGLELSAPTFEVDGSVCTMVLHSRKRFSVNGAQKCLSADGGVSGDAVSLFSNRKDYFYALINDGMGSGHDAALTSNLCSVFLEKMLRAGNRAGTSLRMLNNMVLSRTQNNSAAECSSTVDLLEFDLVTGVASFIKSGAAPSFVVRGSTVHRIQAGTAPIGILRNTEAQTSEFPLKAGDTVVLISDGIQQNDPDCEWLLNYLAGSGEKDPEEIVKRICLHASTGEEPRDDCSAIALRIAIDDEK
ncbi:MAG: SpoIIE family protein phosphatase [Clostridia bacterium]|nr:SpoIIE family protein phosphatase [Clostridia bacterium]